MGHAHEFGNHLRQFLRGTLRQRRTSLDWRFTEQDHRSLSEIVRISSESFEAAGLGTLDFGAPPPRLETMTDAAHQMAWRAWRLIRNAVS